MEESEIDQIERLSIEKLFTREDGAEPPVFRMYAYNHETGTHQIIFQDQLVDWKVDLPEDGFFFDLQTREYSFQCSPANIAELKVRLKPAMQIWLRTPDNQWVVEIFRWSEFNPGRGFAPIVTEAWRENHPPRLPS